MNMKFFKKKEKQKETTEEPILLVEKIKYIKSKHTPETEKEKSNRLKAEIKDLSEEQLMKKYHEETGKNAIWRGNITKQYLAWKEKSEVPF